MNRFSDNFGIFQCFDLVTHKSDSFITYISHIDNYISFGGLKELMISKLLALIMIKKDARPLVSLKIKV